MGLSPFGPKDDDIDEEDSDDIVFDLPEPDQDIVNWDQRGGRDSPESWKR